MSTKFELQQKLTTALERAASAESQCLVLRTQLEAERTIGRRNAAGAARMSMLQLKDEYMRRTKDGESVVISGGHVLTSSELRAERSVH